MTGAQQLTLGDFAPPLRSELSQWHTPVDLANRIAAWAGLRRGTRVLEPCAGGGNLVRACVAHGADVTAVELDPAWATVLAKDPTLHPAGRLRTLVINDDFMTLTTDELGQFDVAVMTPPFEDGQDAAWLEHVLKFAPRVVMVGPSRLLFGQDKYARVWSKNRLTGLACMVSRPVFFGDGGKFDVVVAEVRRDIGHRGQRLERLEWWP